MEPPTPTHAARPTTPARPGRRPWLLAGAGCAALFAVLLPLVAAGWGPLLSLDHDIADGLHRSAVDHSGWTRTQRIFSDWVWDPWTMRALLAVVAGWYVWRGRWPIALWLAVATAAGTVVQQGLKAAVGRDRPQWPDPVDSAHYAAFPSGHALTATLTCGLLLWLLAAHRVRRRWRGLAAAVATFSVVGVGFTRLYLGVHWATDVLAGWLLGVALTAIAVLFCPTVPTPYDTNAPAAPPAPEPPHRRQRPEGDHHPHTPGPDTP
ncbi:phosphatase PAP2 family protein [Streptomyces sp. HSW2009]|uniref:phosphatase PAP2 family protein n=1 Tax=Streptomyces sp. HSW2009 TaxID=3142890 RepID=UPI0032EB1CEA